MRTRTHPVLAHPSGEQPSVEVYSATADTFAGRIHVEWDSTAPVTPFGQLPFFIDYLKQVGLFDAWVADCPLSFSSPNAPKKRDLLGTVMLSVLSGHRRYAHVTALRCDPVNPPLLGMRKIVSEDAVRRGLAKIDEAKGKTWLQNHLDYCTTPLLSEPWVLDMDSTVKTLYGHQEGAETWPAIPRLPYLHAIQPAAGVARRRSAWRRIQRRARHRRTTVIAGSSRSNTPSGAAARRQILGHRACYVARGAKRSGVFVPPTHDSECETRSGPCHASQRLGGCWSRMARQGNQSAPAWLEPASPYYLVAPETGARRR